MATSRIKATGRPPPGRIRVGIGGWTYAPWRGTFFPPGLPHARELAHASRHLTAIEVNGTYYSTQTPATFARWRDETPDGFVFTLKASRFATNRKLLAEAGPSVQRFVASGIAELGDKLGPIVWQFAPTKRFEPADFAAFVDLLPASSGGLALQHVLDVRHPSFLDPAFLALVRSRGVGTVFTDADTYPSFADQTSGPVYARLMRADAGEPLGYAPATLDDWAHRAQQWSTGGDPADLPRVEPPAGDALAAPRDVFVFFINGAKERAPQAALALIDSLR